MTDPAICTRSLSKDYGGGNGVFDLDLVIERGEIFGYLGPNGAGKTTTIRLLLDLARPTSGGATVLGVEPRAGGARLRQRIGYLPGDLDLWPGLTARQIVRHLLHLRGHAARAPVDALAERLGLELDRPADELSKGNRQKIGLLQAFAADSELLILDEPSSGLDPLLQVTFQQLVTEAASAGATVLLSSHVLSEVEHVADRVGIIRRGRLIAVERVEDLQARARRTFEVTFADDPGDVLSGVVGVTVTARSGSTLTGTVEGSMDPFVKAVGRREVVVVTTDTQDLEGLFLRYYDDREDPA